MSNYDNNMQGVLFKNERKTKDTQPAYRGQAEIDGVEYWVSAWVNEVKSGPRAGQKMINMKYDPKEEQPGKQQGKPTTGGFDSFDDDIPFARLGREYDF